MPIPGKASRRTQDLCPCLRDRYFRFAIRALEEGIGCTLLETLRDMERQAHYIATGVSWTENSRHLPQPPKGLALAFDVAPTEYLSMKGWNPTGNEWAVLAAIGKTLGLVWGGDWKVRDRPHFQLEFCVCPRPVRDDDQLKA